MNYKTFMILFFMLSSLDASFIFIQKKNQEHQDRINLERINTFIQTGHNNSTVHCKSDKEVYSISQDKCFDKSTYNSTKNEMTSLEELFSGITINAYCNSSIHCIDTVILNIRELSTNSNIEISFNHKKEFLLKKTKINK